MKLFTVKNLAIGGLIAALYVVFTLIASALGLSSGVIQVRFSEALCILPVFTPAAIPGLFVGCIIANLLSGAIVWDVVFGSIATLIGAIGTYLLRKNRWLAAIPPILSNMIIVPFILYFAYKVGGGIWILFLTVGAGEVISAGILGELLYSALNKHRKIFQ
ncbi:MAG: QueT transporter family protein [Lachnospiraceae bacterium]|nr:QueT transporter family protein [Lachnospiraceae bacterium]